MQSALLFSDMHLLFSILDWCRSTWSTWALAMFAVQHIVLASLHVTSRWAWSLHPGLTFQASAACHQESGCWHKPHTHTHTYSTLTKKTHEEQKEEDESPTSILCPPFHLQTLKSQSRRQLSPTATHPFRISSLNFLQYHNHHQNYHYYCCYYIFKKCR